MFLRCAGGSVHPDEPKTGTTMDTTSRAEAPDAPTKIPPAGWRAILKRSVQEFKHDDITDRA